MKPDPKATAVNGREIVVAASTPPREDYEAPSFERQPLDAVVRFEGGSANDGFGGRIPVG